jgi:1,4-dihydroxy-2-naphthoyl-CoA hydrolase
MAVANLPPFTQLLGVNVLHRSPERSEAELMVREELCNRRGVLHGGAVMALGDTLGGMTAIMNLPDGGRTATIESKTNFFAAVPKGDTAHAVCIPLHRGRTTIVLETRITRGDGKLAAIVTQTQLVFGHNNAAPSRQRPGSRHDHGEKPAFPQRVPGTGTQPCGCGLF